MVGDLLVILEHIMVELLAPDRLVLGRQVADREDRVIERRLRLAEPGGRAAPPVIDQYVKVGEPLDMVPPHRRDEDRVARLKLHRSEEHTSELQSLMRNSYAVF